MTRTFKDAVRAVRRGWVNGHPGFRLFHLTLIGMLVVFFGLLVVWAPNWRARTWQVLIFSVGLMQQLHFVAQMPRKAGAP